MKPRIVSAQPGFFTGERDFARWEDGKCVVNDDPAKDTWTWYPVIAWFIEDEDHDPVIPIPRYCLCPITHGGPWADELPPIKQPDGNCIQVGVYYGPEDGLSAAVERDEAKVASLRGAKRLGSTS